MSDVTEIITKAAAHEDEARALEPQVEAARNRLAEAEVELQLAERARQDALVAQAKGEKVNLAPVEEKYGSAHRAWEGLTALVSRLVEGITDNKTRAERLRLEALQHEREARAELAMERIGQITDELLQLKRTEADLAEQLHFETGIARCSGQTWTTRGTNVVLFNMKKMKAYEHRPHPENRGEFVSRELQL